MTEFIYRVSLPARDKPGVYTSVTTPKEATVIYRLGEWSTAPDYLARRGFHLFAFRDLEAARSFADSMTRKRSAAPGYPGGVAVLECEFDGLIDPITAPELTYHELADERRLARAHIDSEYSQTKEGSEYEILPPIPRRGKNIFLPAGSVMAMVLKPVRELERTTGR